jgi:hypothetical protein
VDFRDGQIRQGKIIAFRDTQAVIVRRIPSLRLGLLAGNI